MAKGKSKLNLLEKKKKSKKKAAANRMHVDDGGDGDGSTLSRHTAEVQAQPEAMDTSEVSKASSILIPINHSGIKKKRGQERRLQRLRKEKSIEKALAMSEKQQAKAQKSQVKTDRVQSLKSLY